MLKYHAIIAVFLIAALVIAAEPRADSNALVCAVVAVEKQHRQIVDHVNFLSANVTLNYPPEASQHRLSIDSIWNPELYRRNAPKTAMSFPAFGCIRFVVAKGEQEIPPRCAPLDVQIQVTMEELRQDYMNAKEAQAYTKAKTGSDWIMFDAERLASLYWEDEKTLYCVLHPDGSYIGLEDNLQKCDSIP